MIECAIKVSECGANPALKVSVNKSLYVRLDSCLLLSVNTSIADMNSSYFALGPPTRRDESVGQSRVIDSSERRSAGWAQRKQLTQRPPCMSAPHTPHTPHTPRTDTLKSQCWHVACLHLIQLHCPCVLWLAECAVCVGLCEQLGWRLQAPRPGHLISPGWPRGLQSWGNTIKNLLSGGGPLYIVLLIKHHRDSLTVF